MLFIMAPDARGGSDPKTLPGHRSEWVPVRVAVLVYAPGDGVRTVYQRTTRGVRSIAIHALSVAVAGVGRWRRKFAGQRSYRIQVLAWTAEGERVIVLDEFSRGVIEWRPGELWPDRGT